jgi:chromosome partitioning protein
VRTLVISNRKGGSGKSSTSVNVAAEMAAAGQRVLLIDLDTQGHCALGLGIKLQRNAPTIHGLLAGHNTLRQAIVPSVWEGLHLAPADTLANHGASGTNELLLRDAIDAERLSADYDTVILDTPPSLDILLMNALCAADRVLVPFVPHFLSGEGVRQLARVLFRVASRGQNDRLKVLGFLPVMQDLRIGQHREITSGVSHQFGLARVLPGVRTDIRIAEAFAAGKPVRAHAPKSRAAQDYAVVASAIESQWADKPEP